MDEWLLRQLNNRAPANVKELILDGCPATCPSFSDTTKSLLSKCVNLKLLSAIGIGLNTLKQLPVLPNLEKLNLGDNKLRGVGLEPLLANPTPLPNLQHLILSGNPIHSLDELKPLTTLPNLRFLYLEECEIAKHSQYRASVFKLIPHLYALDGVTFDGTEVDDEEEEEDDEEENYDEGGEEEQDAENQTTNENGANRNKRTHTEKTLDDEENDDEDDHPRKRQHVEAPQFDEEEEEVSSSSDSEDAEEITDATATNLLAFKNQYSKNQKPQGNFGTALRPFDDEESEEESEDDDDDDEGDEEQAPIPHDVILPGVALGGQGNFRTFLDEDQDDTAGDGENSDDQNDNHTPFAGSGDDDDDDDDDDTEQDDDDAFS